MENLQPQGDTGADPPSAGARYRAHLAQFPERTCKTRPPRWWRELLRALRALAWRSARCRRYEGR